MDDIKLAMLGNKEAAKRLTDAGVLVPCPWCGGEARMVGVGKWRYAVCKKCAIEGPVKMDIDEARLAWNTRAPILSAEEMEMLERME